MNAKKAYALTRKALTAKAEKFNASFIAKNIEVTAKRGETLLVIHEDGRHLHRDLAKFEDYMTEIAGYKIRYNREVKRYEISWAHAGSNPAKSTTSTDS